MKGGGILAQRCRLINKSLHPQYDTSTIPRKTLNLNIPVTEEELQSMPDAQFWPLFRSHTCSSKPCPIAAESFRRPAPRSVKPRRDYSNFPQGRSEVAGRGEPW